MISDRVSALAGLFVCRAAQKASISLMSAASMEIVTGKNRMVRCSLKTVVGFTMKFPSIRVLWYERILTQIGGSVKVC